MKLRNEIKYIINQADYIYISQRLKRMMSSDGHACKETGHYQVDSLYFDDINCSASFEKEAGMENRNKYRIRIYNSSSEVIFLEKKMKRGNGVAKQNTIISMDDYKHIVKGNLKNIKNSNNLLLLDFYQKITFGLFSPKVVVSYIREPFVYSAGEVRITFDKNLSSWGNCRDLFAGNAAKRLVFSPWFMVMEIKYTGFLPLFISKLVDIDNREQEACSKYYYCMNNTR